METVRLTTPLSSDDVSNLALGDLVYISGTIFTCRGLYQRKVVDEGVQPPIDTRKINAMVHVGPIVKQHNGGWEVVSMQPTTSNRYEKWGAEIIEKLRLRAIIGKGTMGPATAKAMKKFGCVHLTTVGILGAVVPLTVKVKEVHWYELGPIEATWVLEAQDFGPYLVDIDTQGNRYFDRMDKHVEAKRQQIYQKLGIPEDFSYASLIFKPAMD